jgi:hypothetical protein
LPINKTNILKFFSAVAKLDIRHAAIKNVLTVHDNQNLVIMNRKKLPNKGHKKGLTPNEVLSLLITLMIVVLLHMTSF